MKKMASYRYALEVLRIHTHDDSGLLSSLRPYCGSVDSIALQQLNEAADIVLHAAERGTAIPASVLSQLFMLTHLVRRWALDEDGMLPRNGLIQAHQKAELFQWTVEMESRYLRLLGTLEEHTL